MLLVTLTSCQLFTKTVYVPVPQIDQCLHDPPPELQDWAFADRSHGCQEPWEICFSNHAAAQLGWSYQALINRVREDWVRCGPQPSQRESEHADAGN